MSVTIETQVPQESVRLALELFNRIRQNTQRPRTFIEADTVLKFEVLFKDIGDKFLTEMVDLNPTILDWTNNKTGAEMCLGMYLEKDKIIFLATEKGLVSHNRDLFKFMDLSAHRERIQKWVDALRSGNYIQGFHGLKDSGCFCVLGLACEISGLGTWDSFGFYCNEKDTIGDSCLLPEFVRLHYGFTNEDPEVTYMGRKVSLSSLNDNVKLSFGELADLIEEEYVIQKK